jgi:hypothetical protein
LHLDIGRLAQLRQPREVQLLCDIGGLLPDHCHFLEPSLSLIGLQFDQGYANSGPTTADVRSHTSAHKIRSQIARAKNRIWFAETNSNRMAVLRRARSPAVRKTLPLPTLSM